ncbi:MAG TPA: 50S ribosomal protein L29 [Deltaproteobacteria bacterium]|nr:50S ribosomal protein L29 [Deltaproteobacteria bacterium]HCP47705.1 50S ribosomal protein L29 [Deltaproteobacteria bacterium]|tara:strand:+ start:644 stop:946 length:303 start_codon:yes stop_codon:yes gene_type:complete
MNVKDLKTLDDKGLLLRRQDLLGEMTSLKFRHATGQLENTAALRTVRRALGRVNTIVRQREMEKSLPAGGLAAEVGSLGATESAFASFRRAMGSDAAENG